MSRTTFNGTFGTPITGLGNGVRTRSSIRVLPDPVDSDTGISVIGSSGDTGHMTPASIVRGGVGISHVKNLLEQKLNSEPVSVEDKSSPGLARLRMTPGGQLKQKQRLLMRKHEDARKQSDRLNVGGGVTLWPEMEDMRLDQGETIRLIAICAGLLLATVTVFAKLHGSLLRRLWHYGQKLVGFSEGHQLDLSTQEAFHSSLLTWHSDYRKLLGEMNDQFDMSRLTAVYQLYILTYVSGVGVLIYFLLDNMFSTNKLSPRRIKAWVSLLTVIGSWTLMMTFLLVTAQQVETAVETNVLNLTETMADIVETDLDSRTFHSVLLYWRTRCLPPTTHGLLTILGVLPVRDVMMYLQYYSLPVIMALVTPIVRLVMALVSIYRPA